jgi:hypothetical protein
LYDIFSKEVINIAENSSSNTTLTKLNTVSKKFPINFFYGFLHSNKFLNYSQFSKLVTERKEPNFLLNKMSTLNDNLFHVSSAYIKTNIINSPKIIPNSTLLRQSPLFSAHYLAKNTHGLTKLHYNYDTNLTKYFSKRLLTNSFRKVFRPILKQINWKFNRDFKAIFKDKFSYSIKYNFLNPRRFSINLFSRFLTRRLAQRFTLHESMKILRRFLRQTKPRGYLIKASGRFTKKQRASNYIYRFGQVTISTFSRPVQYNIENVRLKYGSCSIKFWLDYGGKKN